MNLQQWLSEEHRCEYCAKIMHNFYGSGRFCSAQCARAFSTSKNRQAISRKVSKTLSDKYNGSRKSDIKRKQHQEKLSRLLNQGYVFAVHPSINLNNKYLINEFGNVIAIRGFKELKHNSYSWKDRRYKRLNLTDAQGKLHGVLVHRLVAYTFIPNPKNLPYINHKDENPANNHKENLEWCDCQYNNTYRNVHIRRGQACAETIKRKGGPHNKGIHMSEAQKQKLRQAKKQQVIMGV